MMKRLVQCFFLLFLILKTRAGRIERRWDTSYDRPFSYQCPMGQALSFMHSIHDNHYEDRQWKFHCQKIPGVRDCRISGPANNWDAAMNFHCPESQVLGGMTGVHSNKKEDRIYSFLCCKAEVRLSGCFWTPYLNNYDGPVYYSLGRGQIFHGVHSVHHNHYEDRRWRFQICNTTPGSG